MRLEPGDTAPDFTAPDQTGALRSSGEFKDAKLVLYFYPKAFTPGCTTESCDFAERYETFTDRDYTILGVSPDAPDKLADFKTEYDLPFDLLSDPDHTIATAYGAYGMKRNYGREYMGIIRSTFLIANGTIESAFYNVKATGHAERIVGVVTP
ncbi:MAG: peroxiredoxin [Actinomycetia bacterium]|nr:peroxiredoxin [Actinomycetes bacterium]